MRHLALCTALAGLLLGSGCQRSSESSNASVELPTGTLLAVKLKSTLDGAKIQTGHRFEGELSEPVLVNGKALFPKGTEVQGRVTNVQTAESVGSSGLLTMVIDTVRHEGRSIPVKTAPMTSANTPLKASPEDMPTKTDVGVAVKSAAQNALVREDSEIQFALEEPVRVNP